MKKLCLLLIIFISLSVSAQIDVVKGGKPQSRILVNQENETDKQAAILLQDFIQRISGTRLDILSDKTPVKRGDILIGNFQSPVSGLNKNSIKEDGFHLSSKDGNIRIVNGKGNGSIYGVVTLLEDYLGVRYYAKDACTYPNLRTVSFPDNIDRIENPSFRYRQTQAYSIKDTIYKLWHRLEEPREIFAGNLWVHTFDRILPSDVYGKKHPEYYSFINGERRPGAASQWCLTNPQVFEIVSQRIDSIFKANPGKDMISVSQNDGNATYCSCPDCQALVEKEGSQSGPLIHFMNNLAKRFPNKEFSTLAYLYSVAPPKHVKPLPNVNIMLCDIDCQREVTLTENPSGQSFVKDMEGWSKISNNIFVWDYGINFDNYVSPFPNFHILKPNMELFKKNNATMHFSQIGGVKGTDFSEMRSYIVAKLLWNTSLDTDSLSQEFLKGYYGEGAAPYLYQYLKLREGALLGSGKNLWIYDSPVTHKNGMLKPELMKRYRELFDKAEKASSPNSDFLNRVKEARLPIQYAELEIARTMPFDDKDEIKSKLEYFRNTAKELHVVYLNERNNTIEKYCDLYLQRNFPSDKKNFASGTKVEYIIPASSPYDKIADKALTDGLYGGATFNESWVGWVGKDAEFIIDLGEKQSFNSVEGDFLHQLGAWILLPKSIACYISDDKVNYTLMGKKEIAEDRDTEVKFVNIPVTTKDKVSAQYIKVKIETIGLCPSWHYGVGQPAWFFLDEISVY